MKDGLGRNINYLRISVTDRCNLRCQYCMPEKGIQKLEHQEVLSLEEVFEVIKACVPLGIHKVRITGGEPLIRKGITKLIEDIASMKEIKDIALTTNGVLLGRYAKDLKQAGLKRVNISLDTLDEAKYEEITCGGKLKEVLSGLEAAIKMGLFPIKINTVLIGGFNDNEIEAFVRMTEEKDIAVRFIELMPMGQAAGWSKSRFIPTAKVLEQMPQLVELPYQEPGSPARYYKLPGAQGRVGFINPISHQFCGHCNRIRLTADGKLKPCLHSNMEIDVKQLLRSKQDTLEQAIIEAIYAKPKEHHLNEQDFMPIEREMYRIGG